MRHFKLIGCKVLMRELYSLCACSENVVDIVWMKAALHQNPQKLLRPALQAAIDEAEAEEDGLAEAILLGFGLCSMGIVGLHTKRLPLVAPRAHDCITMLLGSRARYRELFDEHSGGVYWYSPGWVEQFKTPGRGFDEQAKYMEYVEKYGEDNAAYLIEVEKGWTQRYDCAALIRWDGLTLPAHEAATREAARNMNLDYLDAPGGDALLRKLIEGDWDEDMLVLKPGQTLAYAGDERLICASPS